MALVQRIFSFVVMLFCAVLLASCVHKPASQLQQGKQNFQAQRFDLSFPQVKQAAEAGDPDAQYALGYMYYYGKGADQDTQTATMWMRKAAAQGQPLAIKALAMLSPNTAKPTAKTYAAKNIRFENSVANNKPVVMYTANGVKPVKIHAKKLGRYTIQLVGLSYEQAAKDFIATHDLQHKARYYHSNYQGHDWYTVIYGSFHTKGQALTALNKLPDSLRQLHPWVKKQVSK